jgi:hypothetical protein
MSSKTLIAKVSQSRVKGSLANRKVIFPTLRNRLRERDPCITWKSNESNDVENGGRKLERNGLAIAITLVRDPGSGSLSLNAVLKREELHGNPETGAMLRKHDVTTVQT